MALIREPDTPGGFNDSIACKPASSSATADDMMANTDEKTLKFNQIRLCARKG